MCVGVCACMRVHMCVCACAMCVYLCVAHVFICTCMFALHSQDNAWLEEVDFLPYIPPDSKSNRVADGGESLSSKGEPLMIVEPLWVESLEMIDSDLHWLLQQTHHKFWCQVRKGGREGGREKEGGRERGKEEREREGRREEEREGEKKGGRRREGEEGEGEKE